MYEAKILGNAIINKIDRLFHPIKIKSAQLKRPLLLFTFAGHLQQTNKNNSAFLENSTFFWKEREILERDKNSCCFRARGTEKAIFFLIFSNFNFVLFFHIDCGQTRTKMRPENTTWLLSHTVWSQCFNEVIITQLYYIQQYIGIYIYAVYDSDVLTPLQ